MTTYIKCKRCHHEEEEIFNRDVPSTGKLYCEWCGVEDHHVIVEEIDTIGKFTFDPDTRSIVLNNIQDSFTVMELYDTLAEEFSHVLEVDIINGVRVRRPGDPPSYTPQAERPHTLYNP